MPGQLVVSVGQSSEKGRKARNQDFHGAYVPKPPQLGSKGVAIALADGISSSDVSHVASETAVRSFLEDYFCTSDAWSVKQSAQRVLMATNSWLYAQTRRSQYRYDKDRGYVCTLSALVIKSTTAHVFHVGDARVYRLQGGALEQLTEDHRLWVSREESYLRNALGVDDQVEIDYLPLPVEEGDVFVLATDGVYEHVSARFMAGAVRNPQSDMDESARAIVAEAYEQGSPDNLTVQIVRVERLPEHDVDELHERLTELPFPPALEPGTVLDGYEILRELHVSSRSYVYLARNQETGMEVALKSPASDLANDPVLLDRFLTEEWIARRVRSPHVVKPFSPNRRRSHLYTVTEFVDGKTLTQWMADNPRPDIERVRGIVEQIAKGLRALHRQEIVHQDVRSHNVLIDAAGTVKIIDLGSARVAGIEERASALEERHLLGTAQYTAPEYFLGERGTPQSDIFSLGVIAYQMLTGRLPYGAQVAKTRTRAAQNRLKYDLAHRHNRDCPAWVDGALRNAVHPDRNRRYEEVSEFVYDLRHPRKAFLDETRPPLIERSPERFWQGVSLVLAIAVVVLLFLV
ncbi:protein kinase domain-containing protein [Arhodomonas sp. AD133]|uniref:protein kinase domain-containing protein n=1 Tax=Arhodomonas sp. AD133 TaxID=3415009 RepID=UPI003EB71D6B